MNTVLPLVYDSVGDGPPLVILHGLFGSARNWQTVARSLSSRYRVVSVDQRNHGRSPHAEAMDYTVMAADVSALLQALDLREVTLLGHSMGGKVAMTLALSEPARLRQVIMVDIASTASDDQHTPLIDAMLSLPLVQITRRQAADEYLRERIPDPEIRPFLLQNFVPGETGGSWRFNLPVLRAAMPALIGALPVPETARYDGPADAIRGALSDRVNETTLTAMLAQFPHLRVHTVENAGHWPQAEAPQAFMRMLDDCLTG